MSYRIKDPPALNAVSLPMYIFFFVSLYAAWKYVPVYWQKEKIHEMTQAVLTQAHKVDDASMHLAVRERLETEFGFKAFPPDDVEVFRRAGWVHANIYYTANVKHFFGKVHRFVVKVEAKRRILEL